MAKSTEPSYPHSTRYKNPVDLLADISCKINKADISFKVKAKDLDPDGLGNVFKNALVRSGILEMDKAHELVTALVEALINARDYGCLMLDSYNKGNDLTSPTTYHKELAYRLKDPRWCNKEVGISISIDDARVIIRVRDPGKGIPRNLPMPREILPRGRGIMIMRRLTDRLIIRRNPSVVAMIKYRA